MALAGDHTVYDSLHFQLAIEMVMTIFVATAGHHNCEPRIM